MSLLFHYTYLILGSFILFYCVYLMFTLIIGSLYKRKAKPQNISLDDRWIIYIPAYKANNTLIDALDAIEKYPPKVPYMTVVLFQHCDQKIMNAAYERKIFALEKTFDSNLGNTYIQALKFTCDEIVEEKVIAEFKANHVILLDKDNVVSPTFFDEIELFRKEGFNYIQGKRSALNSQNAVASYDLISENLNNVSLRNYKSAMGWNPELTGSAFIVQIDWFIKGIKKLSLKNPGMDKNLFLEWLLDKEKLKGIYASDAIVYEEKTDDIEVLQQQRSRWFAEQYMTAFAFLPRLLKKIFFGLSIEALDYTISILRPPRSILMLLTPLLFIVEVIFFNQYQLFTYAFGCLILGATFFLSLNGLLPAFFQLMGRFPMLIWSNCKSLFSIFQGKAKGNFIHTERKNLDE
ncbi:glycosyltransferase family 2 protein [Flammeovirga sp. MY04]|uniref:glycosyltransferase n=1 Tax=Flammeovirga sp. MY04 TaxID=1191459 RepID=UPI0008249E41|nr:glycosyltransferase family 2 protein [Flammeovirga sp. MY04]ANQ52087.2 glycosyltransferase family 2 protein [Flammeovirga sp. MY04]